MNLEGFGEQATGGGHTSWTSTMLFFMLTYLADVVANGTRTSSGFKMVHLNACARAINEKFNTNLTGDEIKNHLRSWQKRYAKLQKLKKVSGASWDEDNFVITLDCEHYNNHIKVHKADADYFNKPLEMYAEMTAIFGNNMVTGKYAKDSSSALDAEDAINEEDVDVSAIPTTLEDNGASFSTNRPNKRAKLDDNEESGLIKAFKFGSERIATALEKCAARNMDLSANLLQMVQDLLSFDDTHTSYYYSHFVENPHIGRAFYNAPFGYKLNFMAKWISEKFS